MVGPGPYLTRSHWIWPASKPQSKRYRFADFFGRFLILASFLSKKKVPTSCFMERPAIKKKIRLTQTGALLCCVLAGSALPAAAEWAKPTESRRGARPRMGGVRHSHTGLDWTHTWTHTWHWTHTGLCPSNAKH